MRFLVDAQHSLNGSAGGHDAEHLGERQMQTASDAAIWGYALATSAVIVTKDEDFAAEGVDRVVGGGGAGGGLDQAVEHAASRLADMVRDCHATDTGGT